MLAAGLVLNLPGNLTQIGAILIGALLGQWLTNPSKPLQSFAPNKHSIPKFIILGSLVLYALLLLISLLINPGDPGALYALHFRAGSLVFGGGHVVLPLLNDTIVAADLVAEDSFLAGYSVAQALPGPLFTFSAFLGTLGGGTTPAAIGGILALIAIFLPGMLLLIGLLPYWNTIRQQTWAQGALAGTNAAAVGLLLSALIHPVWTHGIQTLADFGIGILAFLALSRFKLPAWLVVLGCGIAGYFFY
jgi:chromate transporter